MRLNTLELEGGIETIVISTKQYCNSPGVDKIKLTFTLCCPWYFGYLSPAAEEYFLSLFPAAATTAGAARGG